MTETRSRPFLPALAYGWLTPYFDRVIALTIREDAFRQQLIDQANLASANRVLDLGCGTGTLAVRIQRQFPHLCITGLDADEAMLKRARAKAIGANMDVKFDRGFSQSLPYDDGVFDRVVSTLFFHHLDREQKEATFREVRRVLEPGGELHIADWGSPTGPLMRAMFQVVRWSDGLAVTRDNVTGQLPALVEQAGFVDVRETHAMNMLFGTVRFLAATKPHEV